MSDVCDSALVQLAITGRTSPVRRRPSTDIDQMISSGGGLRRLVGQNKPDPYGLVRVGGQERATRWIINKHKVKEHW